MEKKENTGRKVKIEGEAFDRVKAKSQALEAATKEANEIRDKAHKELWDTIHDVCPELEREKNHSIERSNEDLGFYVVKEKDGSGTPSGLIAAIKAALSD